MTLPYSTIVLVPPLTSWFVVGAGTDVDVRVVVVGATNRPEELDEAARYGPLLC